MENSPVLLIIYVDIRSALPLSGPVRGAPEGPYGLGPMLIGK